MNNNNIYGISSSFKRGLNHNYLILKYEGSEPDDYQINMLSENDIPRFLKLSVKSNDGGYDFCYEISSMQPLGRVCENSTVSYDKLKRFIRGLILALKSSHEYLLDENNILLDPSFIYINVETFDVSLLLYPYCDGYFKESMVRLGEYILDRVDHSDSKNVMLSYNFYKVVRSDTFTIGSIEELLNSEIVNGTEEKVDDESALNIEKDCHSLSKRDSISSIGIRSSSSRVNNSSISKNKKNLISQDSHFTNTIGSVCASESGDQNKKVPLFERLFPKHIKNKKTFFDKKDKDSYPLFEDDDSFSNKTSFYGESDNSLFNNNFENNIFPNEYSTDDTETEYGKTTLLTLEDTQTTLDCHYLTYLEHGKEKRFILDKLPVVIGKVSDCAELILKDSSVSRMHATIFKDNGIIKLKDIGSTNGTYINEIMLYEDTPVELKTGDIIKFGKIEMEYV